MLKGIFFCVVVNDSNWSNHSFHSQQFQWKPNYQLGSIMFSFVHWPFCCRNHTMRWVQLLPCLGNCETWTKHFFCPFIFTTGSFLTNLTRDRSYGAIRRSGEKSAKKLRQDLRENTKHANSQPRHRFRFVLTSFKTCTGRPPKCVSYFLGTISASLKQIASNQTCHCLYCQHQHQNKGCNFHD